MAWVWADEAQGMRRMHVCAHSPCVAPNEFGKLIELPIHVRRVFVDSGAPASEASPIGEPRTVARRRDLRFEVGGEHSSESHLVQLR